VNVCNYDIIMIRFEWDERKNQSNRKKHRISFEEAQSVFFDEQAIEFSDPDHSDEEARFLMLGRSYLLRVLVVCHCFRQCGHFGVFQESGSRDRNTLPESDKSLST
jgi:uncharacterized DUF497 family protein